MQGRLATILLLATMLAAALRVGPARAEDPPHPPSATPSESRSLFSFQVENVMASVAAAWAVGLVWDVIRAGLASFVNDSDNAPGRFNVFDYKGGTAIACISMPIWSI